MVDNIRMEYPISVNRSCNLIHLQKRVYYYQSKGLGDDLLRMLMKVYSPRKRATMKSRRLIFRNYEDEQIYRALDYQVIA